MTHCTLQSHCAIVANWTLQAVRMTAYQLIIWIAQCIYSRCNALLSPLAVAFSQVLCCLAQAPVLIILDFRLVVMDNMVSI